MKHKRLTPTQDETVIILESSTTVTDSSPISTNPEQPDNDISKQDELIVLKCEDKSVNVQTTTVEPNPLDETVEFLFETIITPMNIMLNESTLQQNTIDAQLQIQTTIQEMSIAFEKEATLVKTDHSLKLELSDNIERNECVIKVIKTPILEKTDEDDFKLIIENVNNDHKSSKKLEPIIKETFNLKSVVPSSYNVTESEKDDDILHNSVGRTSKQDNLFIHLFQVLHDTYLLNS